LETFEAIKHGQKALFKNIKDYFSIAVTSGNILIPKKEQ